MAYDVPEPCESLSRDSYRKWFLSADKEVDPGPHALTGLVLYVGRADIFPHALSLESLDPFLEVSKQDPCLTDVEEDGDNKRLVQLELPMVLLRKSLFNLAIAVVGEAILALLSAEQVPPLHEAAAGFFKLVIFFNLWPFMYG